MNISPNGSASKRSGFEKCSWRQNVCKPSMVNGSSHLHIFPLKGVANMYDVSIANISCFQHTVGINLIITENIIHARKFLFQ